MLSAERFLAGALFTAASGGGGAATGAGAGGGWATPTSPLACWLFAMSAMPGTS